MGRQESIFPISGKLGNQIFYISNGKALVKGVGRKYPLHANSRKSRRDFDRANAAASLINRGFKHLLKQVASYRIIDPLKSVLSKIVNTGPKVLQGSLKVTDGDVALLKGFEFNKHTSVSSLVRFTPSITIDPLGDVVVALPEMPIKDMFFAPDWAVSGFVQFCCCAFYFDLENGRVTIPEAIKIPLHYAVFPGGEFSIPIQDVGDCVLVMGWNILFTMEDDEYLSHNRQYYAGNILEAVNIVNGQIIAFQYPAITVAETPVPAGQKIGWKMNGEYR